MNKLSRLSLILTLTLLCHNGFAQQQSRVEKADTVLINGVVITMDEQLPEAEAVAVLSGQIIDVGTNENINLRIDEHTEVIDLNGKTLLPGFIDAHGHFSHVGMASDYANLAPPPVGEVNNLNNLKRVLRDYIDQRGIPSGQWVIGNGYDDSLLQKGQHPTRDTLDEVSTEHPIFLFHISHHLAALNSKALEMLDINADTHVPEGSVMRRYPNSREPNGVLEEGIAFDAAERLPVPDLMKSVDLLEQAQQLYASYGVTTAQEGFGTEAQLDIYELAIEQQRLKLDVVFYSSYKALDDIIVRGWTPGVYQSHLKIAGVKMMLDGSPQGKTAWLSEAYHVPPKGLDKDYRGYPAMDNEALENILSDLFVRDVHVQAHANGDAAAEQLINGVEKISLRKPDYDHRTVMIHAQTVREDQLDRMQKLQMIPSFFVAHTYFWGDWHRDSVLGKSRAYRISPAKSALEKEIVFTFHNDSPVVPPNMPFLIWTGVNRLSRSGDTIGPEQRISAYDAIKSVTINAAYQYFEEDRKGSITVGKLADLIVVSKNPLIIDPLELRDMKVVTTYKEGKEIYHQDKAR